MLLATAATFFVALTVVAWATAPDVALDEFSWPPIVVAIVVGVPLTMMLNGLEYDTTARFLGDRPPPSLVARVTILSAAANLLPIPGSALVRIRALSERGATYGSATSVTGSAGLLWLGMTMAIGGIAVMAYGQLIAGTAMTALGTAGMLMAALLLRSRGGEHRYGLLLRLTGVELSFIVVAAVRFWLILQGMGVEDVTAVQTALFTVAGSVSSVTGVFPGGLGIRESLVAALSPLVGIGAATGLLASVIDRIGMLLVLALASGVVLVGMPARDARPAEDEG